MVSILKHYDFKHYVHYDGNKELYEEKLDANHYRSLFDGHPDYDFISSIRNPYSLEVSMFRMNKLVEKELINSKLKQLDEYEVVKLYWLSLWE